jgi:SecD/SecF fusion protein
MFGWARGIYSFDYMGHKKWWFALSACIIGAGLVSMFIRGGGDPLHGLKYGLEFKTGTRISVTFTKAGVTVADVRDAVASVGYTNAVIQQVTLEGGKQGFQIQLHTLSAQQEQSLKDKLNMAFGIAASGYQSQTVGPTFGGQVVTATWKAFIIILLLIMLYVSLRFQWKFALGAILALLHDLLVVVGIYSIVDREVTTATIAAVLTILGYSLYDTVIVFDRIRENAPKMRRARYGDMVNRSIWETLTRSINTTLTTLVPVVCLLLFGGATLKDFAFALLVGVASGAYSSVFVASPFVTWLKEKEPQNRKLAERVQAEG